MLRCGCRTKVIDPPQISRMEAANSQTLSSTGKASQHQVRLVCPCLGMYVGDLVICVIHCEPCVYAYQAMFQRSNPAVLSLTLTVVVQNFVSVFKLSVEQFQWYNILLIWPISNRPNIIIIMMWYLLGVLITYTVR